MLTKKFILAISLNKIMRENMITIVINKPVDEVFEFTTNPRNTPLWIPSIVEEKADKYPPLVGTIYKNRGETAEWNQYKVVEYEKNRLFTLASIDGNYSVRYTYKRLDDYQTEMGYFEWMKNGELKKPFTKEIFIKLKSVMENSI
jgi:uncharacterized protein YndB with AHSA1/START domain